MTGHGPKGAAALVLGLGLALAAAVPPARAAGGQEKTPAATPQQPPQAEKRPAKAPLSEKYQKWLDEEVVYIISENERAVFKTLRTDAERDNFIRMFWNRRDPTPDTPVNEFREEHYRRIAYANEKYFEGRTGWRTDRGRVYIMFGPPDFFETNPGGARGFLFGVQAPTAEFPSEVWTYQNIPGLKTQDGRVEFTFVNYYAAGSYQLTDNPAIANALRNVSLPARYAGYNDMPNKDQYYTPSEIAARDANAYKQPLQQLQMMAELSKSRGEVLEELERSGRQRKLRGIVESTSSISSLPLTSKESYFGGPGGLTFMPIVIEVPGRDLDFRPAKDRYQGLVNFYIEVKDANGPVFQKSDRLEMSLKEDSYLRRTAENYQYLQGANLKPGRYFLHLVVWDEISGKVGYSDRWVDVPDFSGTELGTSEIILARDIRRLDAKTAEVQLETKDLSAMRTLRTTDLKVPDKLNMTRPKGGPFTFGDLDISPATGSVLEKGDELFYFYQIYNAAFDEALGVARLRVEERILKDGRSVLEIVPGADVQVPIAQKKERGINRGNRLSVPDLPPGHYQLAVRVRDIFTGQTVERKTAFQMK